MKWLLELSTRLLKTTLLSILLVSKPTILNSRLHALISRPSELAGGDCCWGSRRGPSLGSRRGAGDSQLSGICVGDLAVA